MNKAIICKKTLFLILVMILALSLSGCGSSNSIRSYSNKTTLDNVEKLLGEADEKEDSEKYGYTWMEYTSGNLFCGINCYLLEFYFSLDNKNLTEVYFEAVYEKTNADAVDNLIKDLTKELGNPNIETHTNAQGIKLVKYGWDNDSYVVLREDDLILSTLYFAVEN